MFHSTISDTPVQSPTHTLQRESLTRHTNRGMFPSVGDQTAQPETKDVHWDFSGAAGGLLCAGTCPFHMWLWPWLGCCRGKMKSEGQLLAPTRLNIDQTSDIMSNSQTVN